MENKRFQWKTNGKALAENMVTGQHYRFTMLTPRLIRMEYNADGKFEDRASLHFFYRDFPAVDYTAQLTEELLTIETESLCLEYLAEEPFNEKSFRREWGFVFPQEKI